MTNRVQIDIEDWRKLSPPTFERLCVEMLRSFNFENVKLLGGPGDKGRDIICERTISLGPGISRTLSWVVQCKHTPDGFKKSSIYDDLVKAREHEPDFWWLLTTANVTPATHDWMCTFKRRDFPFRIEYLDRDILSSSMLERPRLLGMFFPDELGLEEQVWTEVMDIMSNKEYKQALDRLKNSDDGVHPRTSYLMACCLSMLAKTTKLGKQLDSAFKALEDARKRGYVTYMQNLLSWPESKCLGQVRNDPELAFLRESDYGRFKAIFGLGINDEVKENCLTPDTPVLIKKNLTMPIKMLSPGTKLITEASNNPELGEVATIEEHEVSGTYGINSEVWASGSHRFATINGWFRVDELCIGDLLVTSDGWKTLTSNTYRPGPTSVYQMSIKGKPRFYASEYLVHNDK